MARETKVGLLAGLGFIICFAIILSNRGDRPPAALAEELRLTQGGGPAADPSGRGRTRPAEARPPGPPGAADVRPNPGARFDIARTARSSGAPQVNPTRELASSTAIAHDSPPSSGVDVLVSGNGRPRGDGVAADRSRPADDPAAVANAPIVRPQPADAPDRAQILREKLDAITGVRPSAPSEPVPRSTTPSSQRHDRPAGPTSHRPAEAMPTSTRYVVRPGDTLSRIAAAQYGSQGQQFINGIADANRGAVTNPDVIRVGMELVLPPIDGVAPAAAPVRRGDSPRVTEPPVEAAPVRNKSFRWYQIRENDRYVSIAREQLGDSGRWKEIYELNKDKFPDPAFIRAGVRIKLPADEVAAKPPGRRH